MKCNTFILKCFSQFTCTNLDGSQKEGDNFLNLLQKEGVLSKGGGGDSLGKWGEGSNNGGNYAYCNLIPRAILNKLNKLNI